MSILISFLPVPSWGMNIKCCSKSVKLLAAWDDAQETDHAYNLSLCEKCGIIYKEDVWNDKGLRVIFLDGSMAASSTDAEWEESGLLMKLDGHLKSIVLDNLKLAEVKYSKKDQRPFITLFALVRRTLDKLFEQPERDELLKMFDLDELAKRNETLHKSGEFEERISKAYRALDEELEMTAELSDLYVSDLLEQTVSGRMR